MHRYPQHYNNWNSQRFGIRFYVCILVFLLFAGFLISLQWKTTYKGSPNNNTHDNLLTEIQKQTKQSGTSIQIVKKLLASQKENFGNEEIANLLTQLIEKLEEKNVNNADAGYCPIQVEEEEPVEEVEPEVPTQHSTPNFDITWNLLKENHGHPTENIHRVIQYSPPLTFSKYYKNYEQEKIALFTTLASEFLNISIEAIDRIDSFFQENIEYETLGYSYFINADVIPVDKKTSTIAKRQSKAVISITLPLYIQPNPTSLEYYQPKIEGYPFNRETIVHFVTPLFNVGERYRLQLDLMQKMYEKDKNIRWILVDFGSNDYHYFSETPTNKIPTIYKNLGRKPFSKVLALNTGAELVTSSSEEDSIIFFLNVDMSFDVNFASVIRNRVFAGKQVFSPACYSYHHDGQPPLLENGFYRDSASGNIGIYASDFVHHPWYKHDDTHWGKEDDNYFNLLRKSFAVYRTYEPNFYHLHHADRPWKSLP